MNNQAGKLTEYAFAAEQERKAQDVLTFLRNLLGAYEFERDLTVKKLEGYSIAMRKIVCRAES